MALRDLVPWRRQELEPSDPESPFYALQREMNRLFNDFSRNFGFSELADREGFPGQFQPTVDIAETERDLRVTVEIPGLDEKDLDLTLSDGNLIIKGEKKVERESKEEQVFRRESSYGMFRRSIALPSEVDEEKVTATYRKGILKITLPKTAAAKQSGKKISVH